MALDQMAIRRIGARGASVGMLLTIAGIALGLRSAGAATITVTGNGDTVAIDGRVTLREAITSINNGANVDADVVALGAYGTNDTILFNLTSPLIKLTSNMELPITKDMTISGPAIGLVAVDGNNATRVFDNFFGVTLTMSNLTIQNGLSNQGGGIWNDGTANLTNCIIDHNVANDGGGFFNEGSSTATLIKCTLSNNTATTGTGGGFYNTNFATLIDCTLSNNTATAGNGGGFWNNESATITGCTFSGNKAPNGDGGGLFNGTPNMTVTNCTFSGNSAANGGGFKNESTATMANCTFSGNSATGVGGGIFNSNDLTLINTIAANSTSGQDCFNNGSINGSTPGTPGGGDHNLIESDTVNNMGTNRCSDGMNGDIVGTDPLLAPLGNYGGPTQTFALCEGPGVPDASCIGRSPAIDAGDDAVTGPPLNLTTDQRGLPRLAGQHVDIGSFEVQPQTPHLAPALSTIGLTILGALLGAFGWRRARTRQILLPTP